MRFSWFAFFGSFLTLKTFLSVIALTIASDLIFLISSLEKCDLGDLSFLYDIFYFYNYALIFSTFWRKSFKFNFKALLWYFCHADFSHFGLSSALVLFPLLQSFLISQSSIFLSSFGPVVASRSPFMAFWSHFISILCLLDYISSTYTFLFLGLIILYSALCLRFQFSGSTWLFPPFHLLLLECRMSHWIPMCVSRTSLWISLGSAHWPSRCWLKCLCRPTAGGRLGSTSYTGLRGWWALFQRDFGGPKWDLPPLWKNSF